MTHCDTFNEKYELSSALVRQLYFGVKDDLRLLLNRFLLHDDLSFTSFAAEWRELKFASIFKCRRPWDAVEFSQGIIHHCKGYVFSTSTKLTVFGIYMIYATINKQFVRGPFIKLRLTMDEVSALKKLLIQLNAENHIDAILILSKMYETDSFHFVGEMIECGFDDGFKKYFHSPIPELVNSSIGPPFDTKVLDKLESMMSTYREKKSQVFDEKNSFFVNTDFVSEVRDDMNKYLNIVTDGDVEPSTSESGSIRAALKKKAFRSQHTAPAPVILCVASPERIPDDEDIDCIMEPKSENALSLEEALR